MSPTIVPPRSRPLRSLVPAAGAGLLERRWFLASGASLWLAAPQLSSAERGATERPAAGTAAASAAPGKPFGAGRPASTTTLGVADQAYGVPSPHEAGVVRSTGTTTAATAGFAGWRTPIQHQRGTITPSGLHFAVHHNGLPAIDPARHRLVVHGLVERPLAFELERLLRYPMVSRLLFLECSGNTAANAMAPLAMDLDAQELHGQLSGSEWTGVPLALLLREAGVRRAASWAIVEGADGGSHQRSLPLAKLLDDAIVALYQNGERLRPSQGYPLRLFVPGWEGNVSVKWLHRIELTDRPAYTKDESGLYSEELADGRIERFSFAMNVKSVITHPSGKQQLPEPKGFYEIGGLAWSGQGRITRVDVSADGGKTWGAATLHGPVLPMALTRFTIPWHWDGRATTLMSRATDEHGNRQPMRAQWKARYAAHAFNHYNAVQVWRIGRDGRVENTYG